MDWSTVAQQCSKSTVLVQITGRDSLSRKNHGFPSSKSENGITTISGSGVVVDKENRIVVTSGAIVIPFLIYDEVTKLPRDNRTLLAGTALSVLVPSKDTPIEHCWVDGSLVGVWACEKVGKQVRTLNSEFQYQLETGWTDLTTSSENSERAMVTIEFIAIVQLAQTSLELNPVTFGNSAKLVVGQQIAVVGSPFGCISPISFFNSICSGVISHTYQQEDSDLVLTDARCLPGAEGGGVFDCSGKLVGVIAPKLTSSGQPMDMTFVIPSNQIAELLSNLKLSPINSLPSVDVFVPQQVSTAKKSVVCLQIGNTWASGFVVSNNGHILTNAHLFKSIIHELTRSTPIPSHEYSHLSVNVYFNRPANQDSAAPSSTPNPKHQSQTFKVCLKAHVQYLSHTHLDVALLQVEERDRVLLNQYLKPVKTSLNVDIQIGMPVWVLAHGFGPVEGMDLVCSYGLIANVVLREGVPASLQTSASVHSGNSGGVLVNSNGELVGMVMSHATHKGTRTFTQLNFSIPYQQFITLVNFANGQDQHAVKRLHNQPTDKFLASLWKFEGEPKETPKTGQNFMKFVEQMKNAPPAFPRSKM